MDSTYTRKERNSNIELLRILTMIYIISHHLVIHGRVSNFFDAQTGINKFCTIFFNLGGIIGINIFYLITGYFQVTKKYFKISHVLRLWLTVFFYSIAILLIMVGTEMVPFDPVYFLQRLIPILTKQWVFPSDYLVFFMFTPFLNILLNALSKTTYIKLLVLMLVTMSIIPTFTLGKEIYNSFVWEAFLYSLAGYIRLYTNPENLSARKYIPIMLAVMVTATVFCTFIPNINFFIQYSTIGFALSVLIFVTFLSINAGQNKAINTVAAATFGVFLIHDDKLMRQFLWNLTFRPDNHATAPDFVPYCIVVVLIIYTSATVIELIRIHLLEKHYMPAVEKFSAYLHTKADKLFSTRICKTEEN